MARTRYDQAVDRVGRALAETDPLGLIAAGCPDDEYDPEVPDLVRLVLVRPPVTADAVLTVWDRWFGPDSGLDRPGAEPLVARLRQIQDDLRPAPNYPDPIRGRSSAG